MGKQGRGWWGAILLLGGLMLLTGCTRPVRVARVPTPPPLTGSGVFVAGIGKVDLTPPPGLPMFGYARARQHDAAGVRTRLYARALYLEDARGERVALVQCDLGAISALLHRQVAQAVVQETGIAADRLLLAATHTHAGPGGYFGAGFYNLWGANRAGYDPRLVTFLAQRIAWAVLDAYTSRAPARLAIGHTNIFGLTQNRSLEAYANNPSPIEPPDVLWTMLQEYRAVDPVLTMIRVDRLGGPGAQPLGAFTNFAIPGTVLPAGNDLYSGDVHAVAERTLEWAIQRHYGVSHGVIHALTNGTVGDVSPAYTTQGVLEAERLGTELGNKAFDLFRSLDGRLRAEVRLEHNYEEVSLRTPHVVDDLPVCQRPMVGVAVLGGSEEGRSPLYNPEQGIAEGMRQAAPSGCHTWKRPAPDVAQDLSPTRDFPLSFTLQAIRVNDLLLVTVPGAMTTELGQRLKQVILQTAQQTNQTTTHVAVVGLANQYASYFTTPEEYELQHYEGASTLYGPASGLLVIARLIHLVEHMASSHTVPVIPAHWRFEPGPKAVLLPEAIPLRGRREAQRLELDQSVTPPMPSFTWQDFMPGAIQFDGSLVALEVQTREGLWAPLFVDDVPVDDRGLSLEVRYLQEVPQAAAGLWRATWYPPGPTPGLLRFVIAARHNQPPLYSEPFTLTP